MRSIAVKPIKNNFNFSSWCLPQICQQLQVLNAFKSVALAIVIERHIDNKTNLKQLTKQHANKTVSTASIGVSRPPFKLKLGICAQPYRPFWKQQVNLELTKSTILLLPHQANSSAFGTLLRGIPGGILVSPVFEHTLTGKMPPYPSLGSRWNTPNATRGLFDHLTRWGFNILHFIYPAVFSCPLYLNIP